MRNASCVIGIGGALQREERGREGGKGACAFVWKTLLMSLTFDRRSTATKISSFKYAEAVT